MRSRALVVPRAQGETARRLLAEHGLLRTDLQILASTTELVLPVRDGMAIPLGLGEEAEREFEPIPTPGPQRYEDLLDWTEAEKAELPRAFDVIGDIVLVRIPPTLEPRQGEIGRALLDFVPGARLVGADRGVHGPERRRRVERIAGSGPWRTRHRENGLELEVDVERAYFSPRLAREHARVAAEIAPGDRVYDLCCGVGPFSVTIARDGRAASVTAVDANPEAIELLGRSLDRGRFDCPVDARCERIEEFLPRAVPVERVILNLPHEGIKYAPSVARAVEPRGRLYYYEVVPRDGLDVRVEAVSNSLGSPGAWRTVEHHTVHPYAPDSDLVAFVLERAG